MEFHKDVFLGMKRPLSPPLMNGGGYCKTVDHLKCLLESGAGGVIFGSITKKARGGNPGTILRTKGDATFNSFGMPSNGMKYLVKNMREMVSLTRKKGKSLIVNVAGFDPDEYALLTRIALGYNADAVELNLSCPNVIESDGSRKPSASFDLGTMESILESVEKAVGADAPIWVKVSAYLDPELLKRAAAVILRHPIVRAVTAINTIPGAFAFDEDWRPLITVGLAGLSGPLIKPIALGQILQWRTALNGRVALIASGGIHSGSDIVGYKKNGASAFQITTELMRIGSDGLKTFERVKREYLGISV